MACIIKTSPQDPSKIIEVRAENGNKSLLFDTLSSLPFIKEIDEAVEMYVYTKMPQFEKRYKDIKRDENGEPIIHFQSLSERANIAKPEITEDIIEAFNNDKQYNGIIFGFVGEKDGKLLELGKYRRNGKLTTADGFVSNLLSKGMISTIKEDTAPAAPLQFAAEPTEANIKKALKELSEAPEAPYAPKPFDTLIEGIPKKAAPNSFLETVLGEDNPYALRRSVISAYDKNGDIVGILEYQTNEVQEGKVLIAVRENAQKQGWGFKLTEETHNRGFDMINNVDKNKFTDSGRALRRKWLKSKLLSAEQEVKPTTQPQFAAEPTREDMNMFQSILERLKKTGLARNVYTSRQDMINYLMDNPSLNIQAAIELRRTIKRDNPQQAWQIAENTAEKIREELKLIYGKDYRDSFVSRGQANGGKVQYIYTDIPTELKIAKQKLKLAREHVRKNMEEAMDRHLWTPEQLNDLGYNLDFLTTNNGVIYGFVTPEGDMYIDTELDVTDVVDIDISQRSILTSAEEGKTLYSLSMLATHPQLKGKTGGLVSRGIIEQMANSKKVQSSAQKIQQNILKEVLSLDKFKKKKIDYKDFLQEVSDRIFPLEVIMSSKYASYGSDGVGVDISSSATNIYNTSINHGVIGHFPETFPTPPKVTRDLSQDHHNIVSILRDPSKEELTLTHRSRFNPSLQIVLPTGEQLPARNHIFSDRAIEAIMEGKTDGFYEMGAYQGSFVIGATKEDAVAEATKIEGEGGLNLIIKPLKGKFAVVPSDIVLTKENIDENIITLTSTREKAQEYINNIVKAETVNRGMFGHTRVWKDYDNNVYIAEIQSDSYQKTRAKELLWTSYERDPSTMNKEQAEVMDKYNEVKEWLQKDHPMDMFFNRETFLEFLNDPSILEHDFPYGIPFTNQSSGETHFIERTENDTFEIADNAIPDGNIIKSSLSLDQLIDYLDKSARDEEAFDLGLAEFKSNIPKSELKYLIDNNPVKLKEKIFSLASLKDKQFLAHEKNYTKRLLREEIKRAANEGATTLSIPTPRTLAVIEGYLSSGEHGIPYSINSAGDSNYLEPGDEIEYLGEDYIVVSSDSTNIEIALASGFSSANARDLLREEVDFKVNEDLYELEQLDIEFDSAISEEDWDSLDKPHSLDDTEASDIFSQNEEGLYIIDQGQIEEAITSYYEAVYPDVQEWGDHMGYTIFENNGIAYWAEEGRVTTETLKQPDEYDSVDVEDFDIENMGDSEQVVLRKYEKLNKEFEKERDTTRIEDDEGNEWIRTEITEEDKMSPVISFSAGREQQSLENTAVHEYGHLWGRWAKKNRPDLWNKGIELVEGSNYLKEVQANKFYQNLPLIDQKEEALMRAIGDQGEKFINEQKKKSFKDWLKQLWIEIKNSLGISQYTPEQIQNISLEEFSRAVAIDLLKGERIGGPQVAAESTIEQEIQDSGVSMEEAVRRNNGNPMSQTPGGRESKLYQDILALPEINGDTTKADMYKAQLYSDNFRNWFGDWLGKDKTNVSKVVDENGEPLMVYHGTDYEFDAFDVEKQRTEIDYSVKGFYFGQQGSFFSGHRVHIAAFISIKKPASWKYVSSNRLTEKELISKDFDGFIPKKISSVSKKDVESLSIGKSLKYNDIKITRVKPDEFGNEFELYDSSGYIDTMNLEDAKTSLRGGVVAVFDPNQIKSVFNTGAFSPTDDRIQFAAEPIPSVKQLSVQEPISIDNMVERMIDQGNITKKCRL